MDQQLKKVRDLCVKLEITFRSIKHPKTIFSISGTGVIIGKGWILTNSHVAPEANKISSFKISNANINVNVKIISLIYRNKDLDLLLIFLEELMDVTEFTPNIFSNSDLEQTEKCHIFGFPRYNKNTTPSYLKGRVCDVNENRITISSSINNGNSGGGVFDKNYKLCGIIVTKILEHCKKIESRVQISGITQNIDSLFEQHKLLSNGIGEYIKIETVRFFIKSIKKHPNFSDKVFQELFSLIE